MVSYSAVEVRPAERQEVEVTGHMLRYVPCQISCLHWFTWEDSVHTCVIPYIYIGGGKLARCLVVGVLVQFSWSD